MGAIARMRDMLVSTAKPGTDQYKADHQELEQFLRVTGAGDHPVFLKMLHNAARWFDEPQAKDLPDNPRPPPNNGRAPGRGRAALYDHPSSVKGRS